MLHQSLHQRVSDIRGHSHVHRDVDELEVGGCAREVCDRLLRDGGVGNGDVLAGCFSEVGVQQADFHHSEQHSVDLDPVPHIVRVLHKEEKHRLECVADAVAEDKRQGQHGGREGREALHDVHIPDDEVEANEQKVESAREPCVQAVHHALRVAQRGGDIGALFEDLKHRVDDLLLGDVLAGVQGKQVERRKRLCFARPVITVKVPEVAERDEGLCFVLPPDVPVERLGKDLHVLDLLLHFLGGAVLVLVDQVAVGLDDHRGAQTLHFLFRHCVQHKVVHIVHPGRHSLQIEVLHFVQLKLLLIVQDDGGRRGARQAGRLAVRHSHVYRVLAAVPHKPSLLGRGGLPQPGLLGRCLVVLRGGGRNRAATIRRVTRHRAIFLFSKARHPLRCLPLFLHREFVPLMLPRL
mmetsp:Transcript_7921/g.20446  ORF Transcript_7921/g.20446 Transcript_7921/m.20446 type:complete len:408 (-) Transcript_7921:757-1980(-)